MSAGPPSRLAHPLVKRGCLGLGWISFARPPLCVDLRIARDDNSRSIMGPFSQNAVFVGSDAERFALLQAALAASVPGMALAFAAVDPEPIEAAAGAPIVRFIDVGEPPVPRPGMLTILLADGLSTEQLLKLDLGDADALLTSLAPTAVAGALVSAQHNRRQRLAMDALRHGLSHEVRVRDAAGATLFSTSPHAHSAELWRTADALRDQEQAQRFDLADERGNSRWYEKSDVKVGEWEVSTLADASRLQSLESALLGAARAETVVELSRGVIHDLNNVFCVVQSFAELLIEATPKSDPRHEDLQEIARAGLRAAVLTERLVGFSRSGLNRPEPFNVADHQRRIEPLVRRLLGERYELVSVVDADDLTAVFDPFLFDQLMLDTSAERLSVLPRGARAETLRALPGFVAARGGTLRLLDEHSFLLELPRALGKLCGVSPPRSRPEREESVLIVEDEQPVRMAMARALRSLGYNVMEARLGGDARDLVRGNNVDLVITDVVLPDGDGLELLSELCRTARRARGLVVTGYADRELARLAPEVPLLRKPFSTLDLARKVRGALDSRDS